MDDERDASRRRIALVGARLRRVRAGRRPQSSPSPWTTIKGRTSTTTRGPRRICACISTGSPGIVHARTSPTLPVFINTFEMKVTASSPVWAWGNWYQSDAYAIGEHDRAQLEFATGSLQTQPHLPVMQSEFQAGWLEQPDDIFPRAADPTNTTLALGTLLAMGAHGVVHFPVQDTLYPAGMEAPFANAFYAWGAALALDGAPNGRYDAVRRFGETIAIDGDALARTHVVPDAAIVSLTSAFDPRRMSDDAVAAIATRTIETQRRCRDAARTCILVDLRFADDATLRRAPTLLAPLPDADVLLRLGALDPAIFVRLRRYVVGGGRLVAIGPISLGLRGEIDRSRDARADLLFGTRPTPNTVFDPRRATTDRDPRHRCLRPSRLRGRPQLWRDADPHRRSKTRHGERDATARADRSRRACSFASSRFADAPRIVSGGRCHPYRPSR